jgi:hypothetical protein
MPESTAPICITCGLSASELTRLNRLSDGRPCPTCRERVLRSLPPALPGFSTVTETEPGRPRRKGSKAPKAAPRSSRDDERRR